MTIAFRALSPLNSQSIPKPHAVKGELSAWQVWTLFVAFSVLATLPIWTHRVPPLSDYANHLARMHVISSLAKNPQLNRFYELDWQIIPNLTMDLVVPELARVMNVYLAGQVFTAGMFLVIASGVLVLSRSLFGRVSIAALLVLPFLYNYVFLVGLMNYIFGIALALWGLAAWVALGSSNVAFRITASTAFVILLFLAHLSALGG